MQARVEQRRESAEGDCHSLTAKPPGVTILVGRVGWSNLCSTTRPGQPRLVQLEKALQQRLQAPWLARRGGRERGGCLYALSLFSGCQPGEKLRLQQLREGLQFLADLGHVEQRPRRSGSSRACRVLVGARQPKLCDEDGLKRSEVCLGMQQRHLR